MVIAGLVLGIAGLALSVVWFIGLPASIVGVVLSALSMRTQSRHGMAIAGLVCSIVGVALGFVFMLASLS